MVSGHRWHCHIFLHVLISAGGSGDPYVYEVVSGFQEVPVFTCEQGPQLHSVELSEK